MKALKFVLIGLVVLVVAVPVAGYAILSNLDFEDLRGLAQDEVRDATGRELVIAGDVDLKISLSPAISLEQVSFANAPWGSRDSLMTVKRFELEVRLLPLLSGDIVVKRLVVVEPDILLETDAEGHGNWDFGPAAGEEAAEAMDEDGEEAEDGEVGSLPSVNTLLIRDGQLTYIDGQSGQEIRLELGRLEGSSAGADSDLKLGLEGRYNGIALSLEGFVGPLGGFADGEALPLDLEAKVAGASLTVKGTVRSDDGPLQLDLDLTAGGASLADFNALAGAALPDLGPYKLSGKLSGAGERYSVKGLAVSLGQSDLSGNLDLALDGKRPKVGGNFIAKLLDLTDFQSKSPGGGTGSGETSSASTGPSESPYVFTADPLPLDGLKGADADVKLTVSALRLPNKLALQDLDLTLKLAAGKLKIEPLQAGLSGGRIESAITLDANKTEAPLALKLTGREIDFGRLMKDLGADESLSGKADLTVDIKSNGGSLRAHASSASGLLELISKEGTVDDQFFKILSVGLSDVLGPLMGEQKQARVNCIVARFDITNGQAQSRGLIFDSESLSVVGQGGIDLKTEKLKLDFDTATRQASLASLAVPFNVRGTLKSPSVTPDPVGAAVGLVGSVASTGVDTAGSIGGLVSGLLGGDSGGASTQSSGNEDPCLAALSAKKGTAPASSGTASSSSSSSGGSATTENSSSSTTSTPSTTTDSGGSSDGSSGSGADKSLGEAYGDFKKDLNKIFGGD